MGFWSLIWACLLVIWWVIPTRAASLTQTITALEKNHQMQMQLADPSHALAVSFCSAAETWASVARHLAQRQQADDALAFLEKVERNYQIQQARRDAPVAVQVAGLNLLYQSLDVLASLLARHNQDTQTLKRITETENRLLSVIGQPGGSRPGPAMAAWSGGVMTMLAVVCGQLDHQGAMRDILSAETQRRRQIDANIYNLKDTSPELQMTMLTNNHLFGALSMLQIIGLLRAPVLKPRLRQIEEQLISLASDSEDQQLSAGVQAVVAAGFLVAPTFDDR
jgi:hypothetical protein